MAGEGAKLPRFLCQIRDSVVAAILGQDNPPGVAGSLPMAGRSLRFPRSAASTIGMNGWWPDQGRSGSAVSVITPNERA